MRGIKVTVLRHRSVAQGDSPCLRLPCPFLPLPCPCSAHLVADPCSSLPHPLPFPCLPLPISAHPLPAPAQRVPACPRAYLPAHTRLQLMFAVAVHSEGQMVVAAGEAGQATLWHLAITWPTTSTPGAGLYDAAHSSLMRHL